MPSLSEMVALGLEDPSSSTPALLTIGGALAVGAYYIATSSAFGQGNSSAKSNVKHPRILNGSSALLGELPAYLSNSERFHEWMAERSIEMDGEMWQLRIPGQKNLVIVTDPEIVEEILHTKFDSFPRGQFQISYLLELFGESIINSDGDRWYHQRKAAAKFFTAKSLRVCMTTSMKKNMAQIHDVIDKAITEKQTIELDGLFHAFTMQTFVEVGLGVELDWILQPERNALEAAIVLASGVCLRRFRVPAFVWKLERAMNIGQERQLAEAMNSIRTWIRTVIKDSLDAVAKRKASSTSPNEEDEVKSVMELFVEHSGDNVEGMGSDDLVDFILTFVLAAHDTSAVTLSWFFLAIMKRPDVVAKIRDEMARVLPEMGVTDRDTYLTANHVQRLVYLEATIKEVLRLFPAAPIFQRETAKDEVLGGDTFIPKGTLVGVSPYSMARLPKLWGPDAAEFKPERWIDPSTGELIVVPTNKAIAFSTGPRTCIGMKLAMLELRVVTANLLYRYDFTLAAPNSGGYTPALSLMLKDPVHVHATRIVA